MPELNDQEAAKYELGENTFAGNAMAGCQHQLKRLGRQDLRGVIR